MCVLDIGGTYAIGVLFSSTIPDGISSFHTFAQTRQQAPDRSALLNLEI